MKEEEERQGVFFPSSRTYLIKAVFSFFFIPVLSDRNCVCCITLWEQTAVFLRVLLKCDPGNV